MTIKLSILQQPPEVLEAVTAVIKSEKYVKGDLVSKFEKEWAERCGMKYAIGVSSGGMALEVAIQALNKLFGRGNEISYTPHTFKAVPNAIRRMGKVAVPSLGAPNIFAHHLHDENIKETLGVIPFIEDCSHAHGYKPVAQTAIFSFFPSKILGAIGDAGIIVTNVDSVRDECLQIRNHGEPNGTNARCDEIQAAALLIKLPYMDGWIKKRKEIVEMYDKAFGKKTPGEFHYIYAIEGSEEKRQKLITAGIESKFYYDEKFMGIPLHPFLTDKEINKIIEEVKKI